MKTIYEYLSPYTKEEIDEMITKLSDKDRELIKEHYGLNLDIRIKKYFNQNHRYRFYQILAPKMRGILKEIREELPVQTAIQDEITNDNIQIDFDFWLNEGVNKAKNPVLKKTK